MSRQIFKNGKSWRWSLVLCLVVVVAVLAYFERPAPAAEVSQPLPEYFLPQFGHGGTPDGLQFSSAILLINLSTTTSEASVFSHDRDNGSPHPLLYDPFTGNSTSSLNVQIPPSGTTLIESLNANPDQTDTGWVGVFLSNNQVGVQSEFTIFNGSNLEARAQVPGRPLTTGGSFPIGASGKTGVAIMNPFNFGEAEVGIVTVNAGGNSIDTEIVQLNLGTGDVFFLNERMNTEGATSAEFRSNVPVAFLPLNQDGLVLTTQDVFPRRNLENLLAVKGSVSCGSTDVIHNNNTGANQSITVKVTDCPSAPPGSNQSSVFVKNAGGGAVQTEPFGGTQTFTLNVPAGGSVEVGCAAISVPNESCTYEVK